MIDVDNSGEISYSEFLTLITTKIHDFGTDTTIDDAFKMFDYREKEKVYAKDLP